MLPWLLTEATGSPLKAALENSRLPGYRTSFLPLMDFLSLGAIKLDRLHHGPHATVPMGSSPWDPQPRVSWDSTQCPLCPRNST